MVEKIRKKMKDFEFLDLVNGVSRLQIETNIDNYCSNCNINCFTNLKSYDEIPR